MIFPGELVVTKKDTAISKMGAEAGEDDVVIVEPGWLCFVVSSSAIPTGKITLPYVLYTIMLNGKLYTVQFGRVESESAFVSVLN